MESIRLDRNIFTNVVSKWNQPLLASFLSRQGGHRRGETWINSLQAGTTWWCWVERLFIPYPHTHCSLFPKRTPQRWACTALTNRPYVTFPLFLLLRCESLKTPSCGCICLKIRLHVIWSSAPFALTVLSHLSPTINDCSPNAKPLFFFFFYYYHQATIFKAEDCQAALGAGDGGPPVDMLLLAQPLIDIERAAGEERTGPLLANLCFNQRA